MGSIVESNDPAIPPEQRYSIEAAKRKREDGAKQYEQLHFSTNERLRHLADDIYANHEALDRLPLPIEPKGSIKFLIMGAGMGGILLAIKLMRKGFKADDIVLVESGGGVGGTWYWNRYPGLHCDVESYVYLPLLEETGYMPRQKYSSSVEIRNYLERIVQHFGLQHRILFRTQASKLEWCDPGKTWTAELKMRHGPDGKQQRDMTVTAEFVLLASGLFPYPQMPRVPGLADFEGPMLHTSRWNYDITGGSSDEAFPKLDKLEGKRVAIVGTGATAIQVVPQVAQYAKELYVFQRTPSQVTSRGQRDTDSTEWRERIASKPGWQKERMENFTEHMSRNLEIGKNDLINDGWSRQPAFCATLGSKKFGLITPDKAQEHTAALVQLDAEHNKKVRERVTDIVKDEETAKNLTPWYPSWCKRPTFSDVYLETFNRDNVHLIDTDGKGIQSVTPNGIVASGKEYPVNVLILSTGYRSPAARGDPGTKMGIEIVGRDGRRMSEKWEEQGHSTLHGAFTNGFPNLFFQGVLQGAATVNYHHVLEVTSEHISSIIAAAHKKASEGSGRVFVEPSIETEDAWAKRIAQGAAFFRAVSVCTPGYLTVEGENLRMPDKTDNAALFKKAKAGMWYKGLVDFTRAMEEWRSDGKLEGVEVTVA